VARRRRFHQPGRVGGPTFCLSWGRGVTSRAAPPPTANIPSSSSTLPPINEAGECRGHGEGGQGRETGHGARAIDSSLATCHCTSRPLDLLPYPESRTPVLPSLATCPCTSRALDLLPYPESRTPVLPPLATCHCTSRPLDLLPYPVSRVPYAGSPATRHCTSRPLHLLPYPVSRVPYPGSPATCHCLRIPSGREARGR